MANKKSLVIVESPAKAKTIEKYLGKDYTVTSSLGHIRDLPKKDIGIDIENGFIPNYEVSVDKKTTVANLKKLIKDADIVWLATDEDREGEAIAWHLYEALDLKKKETFRIVFHEITKTAILEAIQHPRTIDIDTVNAQQARRVLDRLVGYKLSPVLWKKVQSGLSAGRVQSVAVRLIVEREREVDSFLSSSTYKVTTGFDLGKNVILPAELKTQFKTHKKAYDFLEQIKGSRFFVDDIETKPMTKKPAPPFTTSTLQQEASRKLGFSVKQTMSVAQRLYESGQITYMRTDSLNLSETAIQNAKETILKDYGSEYSHTRRYKTNTQGAQEAHEAIRPTDMGVSTLHEDRNQKRLYELIWKRTIASQMSDARLEKTTATIKIEKAEEVFTASGEVLLFDGFMKVYMESRAEENDENGNGGSKILPPMNAGQELTTEEITAKETFKRPPFRYSEATLVKKLEEMGIGRPSTYAPTISTVQDRGYIEKKDFEGDPQKVQIIKLIKNIISELTTEEKKPSEKAKLTPTDIGIIVNDFLVKYFPEIVDYNFTAKVELEFDEIANGKLVWQQMISEFYTPFNVMLENTNEISKSEATQSRNLGIDPKTGKVIYVKIGRYGPMLQLGENDDEEKPKFASLPKDKKFEKITLEEALPLFDLPYHIGDSPDGYKVITQIGRFGPYIRCNKTYVSITHDELFTLTIEDAMKRVIDKEQSKTNNIIQDFADGIQVLSGRYGPYITDGSKNVRIPKAHTPETITLEECKELLANAKPKPGRGGKTTKTAATTKAKKPATTTKAKATATKTATAKKATTTKKAATTTKAATVKKAPAVKKSPAKAK
jgi:DNA topoisomerase-1